MLIAMPVLKNPRHEAFCQHIIMGDSAYEAHAAAGYERNYGNAIRLKGNEKIERRIAELQARAAKKNDVTVASLVDELEEAREAAHSAEQFSAATQAILGKAKLAGLLRDKVEIGGVGDFDACQTEQECLQVFMAQLGGPREALAFAESLREAILRELGDLADPVLTANTDDFRSC